MTLVSHLTVVPARLPSSVKATAVVGENALSQLMHFLEGQNRMKGERNIIDQGTANAVASKAVNCASEFQYQFTLGLSQFDDRSQMLPGPK